MKIRNRFSRRRLNRSQNRLRRWIKIKTFLRTKTLFIKPLSEAEEFLYNFKPHDLGVAYGLVDGKYLKPIGLCMLNVVSRTNCGELYSGIMALCEKNAPKDYLFDLMKPEDVRKKIMGYEEFSSNIGGWTRLCKIVPSDKELSRYCDAIEIFIYGLSNDDIGIVFNIKTSDSFQKEADGILKERLKPSVEYHRYNYKNHKNGVSIFTIPEQYKRASNLEDFFLELKDRLNNLFVGYLPLELSFKMEAPFSINCYQTNIDFESSKDVCCSPMNVFLMDWKRKQNDASVCVRRSEKRDIFKKIKVRYGAALSHESADRCGNIFLSTDGDEDEILFGAEYFINYYNTVIALFLVEELRKDIVSERKRLRECKFGRLSKNFNQYEKLVTKRDSFDSIFEGMRFIQGNAYYCDSGLERALKSYLKLYKKCTCSIEKIRCEYEIRGNINSAKSSHRLTVLSIVIAMLALAVAIYSVRAAL